MTMQSSRDRFHVECDTFLMEVLGNFKERGQRTIARQTQAAQQTTFG